MKQGVQFLRPIDLAKKPIPPIWKRPSSTPLIDNNLRRCSEYLYQYYVAPIMTVQEAYDDTIDWHSIVLSHTIVGKRNRIFCDYVGIKGGMVENDETEEDNIDYLPIGKELNEILLVNRYRMEFLEELADFLEYCNCDVMCYHCDDIPILLVSWEQEMIENSFRKV